MKLSNVSQKKFPVAWYCKLRNGYLPFLQEHYWYYLASYFMLQVYQVLFFCKKRETRLFFAEKSYACRHLSWPKLAMRVLFFVPSRKVWPIHTYTVFLKQQHNSNSNSNKQTESASIDKKTAARTGTVLFYQQAAQRCILRSKQSKHTTSAHNKPIIYLLIISIDIDRTTGRSDRYVPLQFLVISRQLPRPHTLILPFFSFLFFFLLFYFPNTRTHEHTNTRTHEHTNTHPHTTTRPINDATNLPIITQ